MYYNPEEFKPIEMDVRKALEIYNHQICEYLAPLGVHERFLTELVYIYFRRYANCKEPSQLLERLKSFMAGVQEYVNTLTDKIEEQKYILEDSPTTTKKRYGGNA